MPAWCLSLTISGGNHGVEHQNGITLTGDSLASILFRHTAMFLFPVFPCQPVRQPAGAIRSGAHVIAIPVLDVFLAVPATFQIIQLLTEDFNLAFHDCDLVHITALRFVLPYGSYPSPCSVLDRLCLQAGQR